MSTGLGVDLANVDLLRTYFPAIFSLVCTCFVWLLRALNTWKPTRSLLDVLSLPLRPFLTLDDVADYDSSTKRVEIPSIEGKCLRFLCFTQVAGWVFWTVIQCGNANGVRLIELAGPALMGLSWVRRYF
jgi:hypothetical protein